VEENSSIDIKEISFLEIELETNFFFLHINFY